MWSMRLPRGSKKEKKKKKKWNISHTVYIARAGSQSMPAHTGQLDPNETSLKIKNDSLQMKYVWIYNSWNKL